MKETLSFVQQNINLKFLSFNLPKSTWMAIAVVGLIFLLVLLLAQMRRHFMDWSFKGALFGIFFGFLLALFLEGFLLVGGKTALTEFLGWKNAPKPLASALDVGKEKLVKVLGIKDEIPVTKAGEDPADNVITNYQSLSPSEARKVKSLICTP